MMTVRLLPFPKPRPVPLALLLLILVLAGCVQRPRETSLAIKSSAPTVPLSSAANDQQSGDPPHSVAFANQTNTRININTASVSELERLPGIGKGLGERIIEHRERFGPFRRTEHLIILRGISDRRFRALRDMITVE